MFAVISHLLFQESIMKLETFLKLMMNEWLGNAGLPKMPQVVRTIMNLIFIHCPILALALFFDFT